VSRVEPDPVQVRPRAPRSASDPRAVRRPVWPWAAATALLVVHAALAIDTLRQKSVTVDEVDHLPAGISYWQTGSFAMAHHNPPLVKLVAAVPALTAAPRMDYSKSWEQSRRRGLPPSPYAFGAEFMYANAARYHDIYFRARLAVVGLSLLAGAFVFLWGRELFGDAAGLLGLALWTFCPNAIAHAGLVTIDVGATAAGFVATYGFWKYLQSPGWRRAAAAGALLGLAQLSKFTSLPLVPLWLVSWVCWQVLHRRRGPAHPVSRALPAVERPPGAPLAARCAPLRESALHGAAIVGISIGLINAGYLFEGSFAPLGRFPFLSEALTRPRPADAPAVDVPPGHPWRSVLLARENRFAGTWLERIPVPLPRPYVVGFDEIKHEGETMSGWYPAYLRGELRGRGWWWYYSYALLVKVPPGTWLITLAALAVPIAVHVRRRHAARRARAADVLVLLLPAVATLAAMSFLTDLNLGLRYVLALFPYWFVLASSAACWLRAGRVAAAALLVPLAWNVVECVAVSHPHHLAYFNRLAGGRAHGHDHLLDSNVDWGQDLLGLSRWLRRHRPGEEIGLAYFGGLDPSVLKASGEGFEFRLAPPLGLADLDLLGPAADGTVMRLRERKLRELAGGDAGSPAAARADVLPRLSAEALWNDPATRGEIAAGLGLRAGPQPGLFAISVNFLHGLPFRFRDQEGNLWNLALRPGGRRADPYGYFLALQPVELIGGSIAVYDLSLEQANRLRREHGLPPLESAAGARPAP